MDRMRIPGVPNDNNAVWIYQQMQHHGEGIQTLKRLLFSTAMELKQVRANAEAQSRLQEVRLLHLQELLTATCRERDEAQDQLLKLSHTVRKCSKKMNSQQPIRSSYPSELPNTRLADTRFAATERDELNPSTINTVAAAAANGNTIYLK